MKRPFFIYCSALAVMLFNMTACSDDFEEIVNANNEISGETVWYSPEILTRAETQSYFLRDHAVGYSYNATTGETYSLDDVRCQVINRAVLDSYAGDSRYYRYLVNEGSEISQSGSVYHSFTEYVQNSNLYAGAEADIVFIASAKASHESSIFEDGTIDCYVVSSTSKVTRGSYRIFPDDVADLAEENPNVLTASFRDAVRQVAEASADHFMACVDSFIQTYGTHVVTYAEMGGSMDLLVQFEAKKYNTQINEESALSANVLSGMMKASWENIGKSEEYQYLEDAKCSVTVLGGDVSILDSLTNMNSYRVDAVDVTAVTEWQSSVVFDPNDYTKSTASVIDMEFTPIYEFVTDETAKGRIKNAISGSAQYLIDLLVNRNMVNVSFPYDSQNLSYTLGNTIKKTSASPEVTNLVYGGRHVATICKEQIDAIDSSETVRVVYPIYEGRIQLYNGVCAHNGLVYGVAWNGDNCTVTNKGTTSNNGTVYVTAGAPDFTSYNNITYSQAHPLPALETDTPFKVDGSYDTGSKTYYVQKDKSSFYLPETKGISTITGIPNWQYDEDSEMMKRDNDNYVYLYDPDELKYND